MKAFDKNYKLLDEMYQDGYYPDFLVDKVKGELQTVIELLEAGETDVKAIPGKVGRGRPRHHRPTGRI